MNGYVNAILGTVIAALLIAGVVILGIHGTLSGDVVSGLFGALIGGGAVGTAHASGVKSSK